VKRDAVYQRFPVAMRVYEAIAEGYLTGQLDIIVIRWYRDDEARAHSVKLDEKETPMEDVEMEDVAIHPNEMEETMAQDLEIAPSETNLRDDKSLGELIQKLDTKLNKGKKPKKKSTAALKVRNMQIKSKAKGDAKRIPKVEDRFFLEVVMISKSNTAEGSFCFLAKKDPMERILQVVAASTTSATDWEFLVPTEDPFKFNIITDPLTSLKDAEERQILKCFDRIILCPRP
jgi:hypothetical protein